MDELSQSVFDAAKQLPSNLTTCFKPTVESLTDLASSTQAACFTDEFVAPRSIHHTFAVLPGQNTDFTAVLDRALKGHVDENGVHFEVDAPHTGTIQEMRDSRWIGYAARTLVVRFWDLAKVSRFHHFLILLPRAD